MAERQYFFNSAEGRTTTTSTTDQNKVNLVHTPDGSTTYYYFATCQLDESVATSDARAKLENNAGTAVAMNVAVEPQDLNDTWSEFGLCQEAYGASPGEQTYRIDFSTETGGTVTTGIAKARILAIKKGADDVFAESTGATARTSSTYATKVTHSFTPPSQGDYLLFFCCEFLAGTTGDVGIRGDEGGTKYGEAQISRNDVTTWSTWSCVVRKNLTAVSRTQLIEFQSEDNATSVQVRNARVLALRLDAFEANYYAENLTRATTTSATPQDRTTLTDTPQAVAHMIFGGFIGDYGSTTSSGIYDFEKDGTSYNTDDVEANEASDEQSFRTFSVETLAASSTTWKTQYSSESAGTTTGIDESTISVVQLALATTSITPQDLAQLVVLDNTTLTQNHVITSADLAALVFLDNGTITQNHVLTARNAIAAWDAGYPQSLDTVLFDGVNDYLTRSGGFSGAVDGSQGTLSVWLDIKSRSMVSDNRAIIGGVGGWGWYVAVDSFWDNVYVWLANSDGSASFEFSSSNTRVISGNGLYHVLVSWDTNFSAGNKLASIAINGQPVPSVFKVDTDAAFNIDYTATTYVANYSQANRLLNAGFAKLWFDDVYIDAGLGTNIHKFINSDLTPADLGSDGSTPTGSQPILYLEGPASSFATNLGSGGNMTVTGSLEDITSYIYAPVPAGLFYSLISADMTQAVRVGQPIVLDMVAFDGSNDYLTRGNNVTGLASGTQGTASVWVRFQGGDGVRQRFFTNGTFIMSKETSNRLQVALQDSSATLNFSNRTDSVTGLYTTASGLIHILVSWDTNFSAGNKIMKFYVNDVDRTGAFPSDTDPAFEIDYTTSGFGFGARHTDGADKLFADVAEAWFSNQFIDPDIEANRRHFIDADGAPVNLGINGERPLGGVRPNIYFKGPAASFNQDRGSGDTWTVNGALVDASSPSVVGFDSVDLSQGHAITSTDLAALVFLDNASIAQDHVLTSADLTTLVFLDDVTILVVVSLVPSDLMQLVLLDNTTITQDHVLTSSDLTALVFLDNLTLIQNHAITSADLAALVFLDSITLTQDHVLTSSDLAVLVFLDNTTITQDHVLTSSDLTALVFLDEVTVDITGVGVLVVASLAVAVVLDNATITQDHSIASTDLTALVFLDNDTVTQNHVLTSDDLVALVFLDNDTITQTHALASADLTALVFLDNAALTQNHIVATDSLMQLVTLDNDTLTQTHMLSTSDLVQVVVLDNATLTQDHVIGAQDLTALVFLDEVSLLLQGTLEVHSLVQDVFLDTATLTQDHGLLPTDLVQLLFLDNTTITQDHVITAADLLQEVFLDNITLTQGHVLTSDDLAVVVELDSMTGDLSGVVVVQLPVATIVVSGDPSTIIVGAERTYVVVVADPRFAHVEGGEDRITVLGGAHIFEVGSED